ncbi:PR5-like receptor kinase [Pistacia vera]|uniref:PR5-like receptor kinase n=1 Tax=Pistacia vera TaxID=55513 RepID=UPI00126345DF|nr:PR5-like receptor kinase [Pistacia vera]
MIIFNVEYFILKRDGLESMFPITTLLVFCSRSLIFLDLLTVGRKNKPLVIGVTVASCVVGLGVVMILCILLIVGRGRFLKKKTENDKTVQAFVRNYDSLTPHRYSYYDVKKMTTSFRDELGQGGFGDVYKGMLLDGRLVAVKVLKESKGNGEEFINEVASISRTSHVNIFAFLGFCYKKKKRALIYEFMSNGSLEKFIYDNEPSSVNRKLEWETMSHIVVGIARGLEYLHRRCNIRIVYFDIKPHNILLDEDFCPKISNFGLAKQSNTKESIISMLVARGTMGYTAPKAFCQHFGEVSHKSDVYSYEMMVLEMIGGRKNIDVGVSHTSQIYFPHWIHKCVESGKDLELHGVVTDEEKEIVKKMILVGLWCIQTNPSDRPSKTKVVEILEGSLENLEVPPKPYLSSPTRSPQHSSPTSST